MNCKRHWRHGEFKARGKQKEAASRKSETLPVKYKNADSLCIKALSRSTDDWMELVVGGLFALGKLCFPVCLCFFVLACM